MTVDARWAMDAELLPPVKQTLWGWLAVANFFLGGVGAGAYLAGAVVARFEASPLLVAVSVLGPVLAIAGFSFVAAEAGRPVRGPFVLRRIASSWMSRELWVGGAFVILAALDLALPWIGFRLAGAMAAVGLLLAQGFILSRARGVTAWNNRLMPVVFLTSGLASGAGALGILAAIIPGAPRLEVAWVMAGLILVNGGVWAGYLRPGEDPLFRRATARLRGPLLLGGILGVGHLLPLMLLAGGAWFQGVTPGLLVFSGLAILTGLLGAKAGLVLKAGELRPITIPALGVRLSPGRRSLP